MDFYVILCVAGAFLLAGFVKGIIGMGLPPISMGLMALVLAPAQAAALVLIPSLVTNLWQMTAGPGLIAAARRFATLLIGICAGTWLGADVLTSFDSKIPNTVLGIALAIFTLLGLGSIRFHIKREHELYWSPVIGVLSGLVMASTGVMVVPLIPYLHALELDKDELLQTLGATFVVAAIALAILLYEAGVLRVTNGAGSAIALIPTALGMFAGRYVMKRIDTATFRFYFLLGLLALGLFIVIKAAFY
jgi:uncharacterized membrane protein YfcA